MSQPATIALCTLTGMIVLVAILQSLRLYRRDRASNQDFEKAEATPDSGDKFDADDNWVFRSVTARSCGNVTLEERSAAQVAEQAENNNAHGVQLPSTTSTTSSVEVNLSDTPTSIKGEVPRESDVEAQSWDNMPRLPSPGQIYQAHEVRFLHASLVPVPLRPQPQRQETPGPCEERDGKEMIDVDIYRSSEGDYCLHPHPLRSHPVSMSLPLQKQETQENVVKGQAHFRSIQQSCRRASSDVNAVGGFEEKLLYSSDSARWGWNIYDDKVFESSRNAKIVSARVDSGVLPQSSVHGLKGMPGMV
ncbi:hypothetical protein EDD37DRAFT_335812 [Exophiala viscosa]|uniref:uncharacterized protein n=1 Tax=Exophiala viscosa TaxID=2486360 RepID=UPI00218F7183|nr:hypothetical protein EDD37DRAFT_335812 [Exophiala viscosa]